jgi:hypothetical protein
VPSPRSSAHGRLLIAVESASKRTFATAVDWPGWSRSGKTEELAIEALLGHADRYAAVAEGVGDTPASLGDRVEVVERSPGGGGTDFGVPSRVTESDRRPTSRADAERLARFVEVSWATFDRIAGAAPAELRKGPRGGGRDTAKIVAHVLEADHAYAREIGLRVRQPSLDDRQAIEDLRAAVLEVLRRPSDGGPLADRRWTARYAAHRIAWHALDHAWEIEDRTEP